MALKSLKHFDLKRLADQEIESYGRIVRIGKRPDFYFLKIRTGDCMDDATLVCAKSLFATPPSPYSTIRFRGQVQLSPDGQSHEIKATEILYYGRFPPEKLEVSHGMVLEAVRPLESQRLLTRYYSAILWLYQLIEDQLHGVSRELGLMRVRTPAITFSDCEGAGELFRVETSVKGFFQKPAFLTVSGQVDEETVTSRLMCPTYTYGPSFRADPSQTRWHVCEFYHYEPEVPFITLQGLMDLEEETLKRLIQCVLADPEAVKALEHLKRDREPLTTLVEREFARISYTEAVGILQRVQEETGRFETRVSWGDDLHKEHEKYLCEEHFQRPTFVYRYPKAIKSFYMAGTPDSERVPQGETVDGVDLLVPGIGELCGGSIREHCYDVLLKHIKEKRLKPKDYQEYLRLAQEGPYPHGGYGLGFDRLVMFITGAEHIRDVTAFPRFFQHSRVNLGGGT
jgi:asparaginyl-tRNA synthetase